MGFSGVVLRQPAGDFPCTVVLGKKAPSFGLFRYKQGLRFVPPLDEGFALRGDGKRLVYSGRRRSHRFTVLGDAAFEYDCILLREPDCNVVVLRMEGAEQFDFFRQPDFVREPSLKGSYAVYKKETLAGEGTGKLCHVRRPRIIDALGRRCWGDLSVCGDELRITIPEGFLSGASYPVVVDPVVGTSAVGSQYRHVWEPGEPAEELMFEMSIPVNRFVLPETVSGSCTAYVYVNSDYPDAGGCPVVYSDNGNKPRSRISVREGFFDLAVKAGKPAGWRQAGFSSNGSIPGGTTIWFGVFSKYFWMPRFDYGAQCYWDSWEDYEGIPDTYPLSYLYRNDNFKLSMYFNYSSAQNYIRTLTQGVTLVDGRKLKGGFYRKTAQTAGVSSGFGRGVFFCRRCVMAAASGLNLRVAGDFFRGLRCAAGNRAETFRAALYLRENSETVGAAGAVFRGLLLFVRIFTAVFVRDWILGRFLIAREVLVLKSPVCREIVLESKIG